MKNILQRYMEDSGCQYIHKLNQFVTTLISRRNCSVDLIPKNVEDSRLITILYSEPLREIRKPKFKIGDRVRILKYDLSFRKGYKLKFTEEIFKIVAISSRKPPTYTIKDEQDEFIRGRFYQKELIKVTDNRTVYNRVGFKCIFATISRQYTEPFYNFFTRATESRRSMGGCNFGNILPNNVPKCYGGKIYGFWQKFF